jgi:hypothetical protein
MKRFLVLLCGLWAIVALAGCGYTTRAFVAKTGYQTVYVTPFVNKVDTTSELSEGRRFRAYYPLLENRLTNAVVERFISDGNLRSTKEPEADVVLRGELVSYSRDTLRSATDETPEEVRLTIFVNIVFEDRKTGKIIFEKRDFAGDTSYYTTGQYVKSESQAVEDAVRDLARRIVESIVEAW